VRFYLVQPDDALADELIQESRDIGYAVLRVRDADPETLRALGDDRPDAVVVCLDGDADAALVLAEALIARRSLRGTPLVFAGGTQAALNRAQDAHPRASFARRDVLLNVLASLRG
jgi:hypothetical protein